MSHRLLIIPGHYSRQQTSDHVSRITHHAPETTCRNVLPEYNCIRLARALGLAGKDLAGGAAGHGSL